MKRNFAQIGQRALSVLLCMTMLTGALAPATYAVDGAPAEAALDREEKGSAEVSCPVCGGTHEESACGAAALGEEEEGEPADTTPDEPAAAYGAPLDALGAAAAYDIAWYSGAEEGTTEFTLSTAAQLAGLAAIVNGQADGVAADSFSGKTVTLANGIDLSDYLNGESWTPIGASGKPFKGTLDGKTYTVSGLRIGTESEPVTTQYQGLFGVLNGATISNLTVEGSIYVAAHYVGGVAADISGGSTLDHVTGKVNVTNSGNTYSAGQYTGGLVGRVSSGTGNTFVNCANSGTVSAAYSYAGGLIGCVNAASTAVTDCANSGAVSGTGSYVGGLIGQIYNSSAKVELCYNSAAVSCGASSNYVGGLTGQLSQGTVQNCYSLGAVTPAEGNNSANLGALVGSMVNIRWK